MNVRNDAKLVFWLDVVTYNYKVFKRALPLTLRLTIGRFVEEKNDYVFLKHTVTFTLKKPLDIKTAYKPEGHNFFWIPREMVVKMKTGTERDRQQMRRVIKRWFSPTHRAA